jgi:hypothetical protein
MSDFVSRDHFRSRLGLLVAIVLFGTAALVVIDYVLFVAGDRALHLLWGKGIDLGLVPAQFWNIVREVLPVLAIPAAAFSIGVGVAHVFFGGASWRLALATGLAIGTVEVLVLASIYPDHDPPEIPLRLLEIWKVLSFACSGMAVWQLIRRVRVAA